MTQSLLFEIQEEIEHNIKQLCRELQTKNLTDDSLLQKLIEKVRLFMGSQSKRFITNMIKDEAVKRIAEKD